MTAVSLFDEIGGFPEALRRAGVRTVATLVRHGMPQADAPRYRQLGNSVAVPVFEWVSDRIVRHES